MSNHKDNPPREQDINNELSITGLTKIVIGPQQTIDRLYTQLFHAKQQAPEDTLSAVKSIVGDLFISTTNPFALKPAESQKKEQEIQEKTLVDLATHIHNNTGDELQIKGFLWLIDNTDAISNPTINNALRKLGATDETFSDISKSDHIKVVDVYR